MSISSEISRLGGNISDALDAVDDMGGTVPNGATSDDLAAAILSIPQSGGAVSDVFWVDVLLDLQTMSISNISHTYSEILAAYNAGKIIKARSTYYLSASVYETALGELRVYHPVTNEFTFDLIVPMNIGYGMVPYYFVIELDDNNRTFIGIYQLNATAMA